MKPIVPHPEAEEEFHADVDRYEDESDGLGAKFREAIEQAVEKIRRQPNFYPLYEDTPFRECPVSRFPYAVYYLERDDDIWVVAFANQRRKPGYWLNRRRRS
ncbi:MAG: type II toxin-antitoxin system RelE/ParE family toxin [Zavarzinella sp.]|nr:type II toxin-antitoxin system RelE/ParE family toxin [Zavarzinella sp.]